MIQPPNFDLTCSRIVSPGAIFRTASETSDDKKINFPLSNGINFLKRVFTLL